LTGEISRVSGVRD